MFFRRHPLETLYLPTVRAMRDDRPGMLKRLPQAISPQLLFCPY